MNNETNIQKAIKIKKRTTFIVWLIPLIALLIASFLVVENLHFSGGKIVITFDNAAGIIKERTKLLYKGVTLGHVESIEINENDLKKVDVTVQVYGKAIDAVAKEGVEFWLVQPKVSLTEITGLGTLVSGNYIEPIAHNTTLEELELREDKFKFNAIENVSFSATASGIGINLNSKENSITSQTPILYKKFIIGSVYKKTLTKKNIVYKAKIYEKYRYLLKENSKFYINDNVGISANISGLKIKVPPFSQIITGGITMSSDENAKQLNTENSDFKLFDSVEESNLVSKKIYLNSENTHGLSKKNSKVYYKGVEAGVVTGVKYEMSSDSNLVEIELYKEFEHLNNESTYYWVTFAKLSLKGISGLNALTRGSFISFETSNTNAKPKYEFKLHESKKLKNGVKLSLNTTKNLSLIEGAEIYFNNISVGEVYNISFTKDLQNSKIEVVIYEKYKNMINDTTLFFMNNPLEVEASLAKTTVKIAPLNSLFSGAISFVTLSKEATKKLRGFHLFSCFSDLENEKYRLESKKIFLELADDCDLKKGASILYKNIEVGKVDTIELKNSEKVATAYVKRSFEHLLKEDSVLYTQSLSVGVDGIKNLNTIIGGTNIAIIEGISKKRSSNFALKKEAPPLTFNKKGLRLILKGDRKSSLDVGTYVYYRQFKIGQVEEVKLADDSKSVDFLIYVEPCFAYLVKDSSLFYNAGALGMEVSLTGIKVQTQTVETMVEGGIYLVTPNKYKKKADELDSFILYNEPAGIWLDYSPELINDDPMCS